MQMLNDLAPEIESQKAKCPCLISLLQNKEHNCRSIKMIQYHTCDTPALVPAAFACPQLPVASE
jgi:hypothetical protein